MFILWPIAPRDECLSLSQQLDLAIGLVGKGRGKALIDIESAWLFVLYLALLHEHLSTASMVAKESLVTKY